VLNIGVGDIVPVVPSILISVVNEGTLVLIEVGKVKILDGLKTTRNFGASLRAINGIPFFRIRNGKGMW
jgi:hypothetical protein